MIAVAVKSWGQSFRSTWARIAAYVCLASALAGCGSSAEKEMGFKGPAPTVPKSEAITKFMGPDGIVSLYVGFDEIARTTASTRAAVTQPKFVEAYEAFKNEPLPKEFKSDKREQDKTKLIQAVDALVEGVKKNGTDDEIRTLAQPIRPAAEAFMRPTNY